MDSIRFRPEALQAITKLRAEMQVPEDYLLRVGTRSTAGCLGISYLIGFDRQREADRLVECAGMRILIDTRHSMHVLGMEIGYEDRGEEKGFIFTEPSKE